MNTVKDWNVLTTDVSKNSVETEELLTSYTLIERIGMWGEGMFGSFLMLGSGVSNSYLSNVERNILISDNVWNVDRRLASLVSSDLTEAPEMWGHAMFGSIGILGAGTLTYYEG